MSFAYKPNAVKKPTDGKAVKSPTDWKFVVSAEKKGKAAVPVHPSKTAAAEKAAKVAKKAAEKEAEKEAKKTAAAAKKAEKKAEKEEKKESKKTAAAAKKAEKEATKTAKELAKIEGLTAAFAAPTTPGNATGADAMPHPLPIKAIVIAAAIAAVAFYFWKKAK